MQKIFWGLLFLFIDISLGSLSITPSWVGYLLIRSGMGDVSESAVFQRTRTLAAWAAAFSGVIWLQPLLNISIQFPSVFFSLIMTGIGLSLQLLITYRIVEGVRELETVYGRDMQSSRLLTGWKIMLAGILIAFGLMIFLSELAAAGLILTAVAAVYYVVKFYRAMRIYKEVVTHP